MSVCQCHHHTLATVTPIASIINLAVAEFVILPRNVNDYQSTNTAKNCTQILQVFFNVPPKKSGSAMKRWMVGNEVVVTCFQILVQKLTPIFQDCLSFFFFCISAVVQA